VVVSAHVTRLTPWPLDEHGKRNDGLNISAKIESPTGWLNLEDGQYYSLHGDSLAGRTQTYRRREVSAEWIEGTFPVSAVRDNTIETIAVWVRGDSHYEYRTKQDALAACFEQLAYQFMMRVDDVTEYWQCFASDYGIELQREFRHAIIGVVRATVQRLPQAQVVYAAGDDV
jgi:hypothetical protein